MNRYEDIIHLPHHTSQTHPRMSMIERAAQFSPFAALAGFQDVIAESAEICDNKKVLSEDQIQMINAQLQSLRRHIQAQPLIRVTFFQFDERKDGGTYITMKETCKKIDDFRQMLYLANGRQISFHDIYAIEYPLSEDEESCKFDQAAMLR